MEPYLNKEQTEAQQKAQVLIEALPYIQKFNRKIIVVKYGGSAMSDEELQRSVIQDVTLLKLVGFKPIIVHGGGKAISSWVKKSGKEAKFINGLRVTDAETCEIAEMVLGSVSKKLVSMVAELGIRAVGISGKDGNLLHVKKKYADGQDIGFVGEVTDVDPKVLFDLLEKDYLPIVAPLGMDDDFNTYNINADEAASAIARAVCADKLVYLTDITGSRTASWAAACFPSWPTAQTQSAAACTASISWTAVFPTACCSRSLQTKASAPYFIKVTTTLSEAIDHCIQP